MDQLPGSEAFVITEVRKAAIFLLLSASLVTGICASSTPDKEAPEKCADCHSASPAFKEWQNSGHASSLKTLLKDPGAAGSCLRCHSADYKSVRLNPWIDPGDLPTPQTASNPVSCSACHRHDSGIKSNLIMPADKLCVSCHVRFCGG
jgi:predicted CXXCH cytochrome family protein